MNSMYAFESSVLYIKVMCIKTNIHVQVFTVQKYFCEYLILISSKSIENP